jgi:hypothetical protein|tara:strand:+ start:982 stop:1155 length:174 start_codon:yes stop_codon:yes gene_type:complete
MPNQRDPDKRELRAWMYSDDLNFLKSKAKEMGIPLNELIIKLTKELKKENKKNNGRK